MPHQSEKKCWRNILWRKMKKYGESVAGQRSGAKRNENIEAIYYQAGSAMKKAGG